MCDRVPGHGLDCVVTFLPIRVSAGHDVAWTRLPGAVACEYERDEAKSLKSSARSHRDGRRKRFYGAVWLAGGVLVLAAPASSFFFSSRRRHTRLQGDWSSDVCSSD